VGFALAILVSALAWTFTLRPEALGGPASYVMVRGVSMVPTYHTGDLVVVHRRAAYGPGDLVAYRIPGGDVGAGTVVIHRIVGGSGRSGFVVKGDNNLAPDDWRPRNADVVGKAWFVLPRAGTLLAFLHAPLPLASLAAGVTVALIAVPRGPGRKTRAGRRRRPRP
jgi:signal peptidase